MAFTDVITVATGDLWTASNQNTYLRDNFAASLVALVTTAGDLGVGTGSQALKRLALGAAFQDLIVNAAVDDVEWGYRTAAISDTVVETTDTTGISITTINQNFKHLMGMGLIGTDVTTANIDTLVTTFNNPAIGNRWYRQNMFINDTTFGGNVAGAGASYDGIACAGGNGVAPFENYQSPFWFIVPNYTSSDTPSTIISLYGIAGSATAADFYLAIVTGTWASNLPLTDIDITPTGGTNFLNGSRVTVYGFG